MNPPATLVSKPEFIPPPLRAHQAADLWLALQKKEATGLAYQRNCVLETEKLTDVLTSNERRLYEHLTARLVLESNLVAITVSAASPS